ncbi:MAG: phospholipase D-like domain-containing protein [Nanoarchaeota archaeon]|nr:phospholipase D-like domain-containing protein [Nanoarchaeota archaeon]
MRWLLLILFVLVGCSKPVFVADSGGFQVVLCSQVDCFQLYHDAVAAASTVDCAFFSVAPSLLELLEGKHARLVVDRSQSKRVVNISHVMVRLKPGLMHNKFCILDHKVVVTGSFNVVARDSFDHVVVSSIPSLVANYQREFDELFSAVFGAGDPSPLVVNSSGFVVENYFCPEDDCESHVLSLLSSAQSSIHFLLFSFTSDRLGDVLVDKFQQGLVVSGVVDKEQLDDFSEFKKLEAAGVPVVVVDGLLHHKVFIVDNRSVVLGSYNPSRNGNVVNDENLLIVHDPAVASLFLAELASFQQ